MGCLIYKSSYDPIRDVPKDLWSIPIQDINLNETTLDKYKGNNKAFLFINVACSWGLTSVNYKQLVEIYNNYKDKGLVVLGFPCGQFFNQELKNEEDIKKRVEGKYNVDFPMFSKIKVNGEDSHPIYKYLKFHTKELNKDKGLKNIPWNFTKFLVDADGNVVNYYLPSVKPNEIVKDIEKLL